MKRSMTGRGVKESVSSERFWEILGKQQIRHIGPVIECKPKAD